MTRTKPILRCQVKPVVSRNRALNVRTHGEQTFGELIITPK